MSTPVSASNTREKSNRGRKSSRRPLIIVCAILSLFLVMVVVMIKGSVSGTEFAPSHFQTREFSFYEIPFLHIQITPIDRKNRTGAVESQLRSKSWVTVPRGVKAEQWHLIHLDRGPTGTPAVAGLLLAELELQHAGQPFWVGWNNDHPLRAAVLWPIVQSLAERELYVLLPELLRLARTLPGDDNAAELSGAIDTWLVDQYVELVKDLRDANRSVLADEMLAEAIADYPSAQVLADLRSNGS